MRKLIVVSVSADGTQRLLRPVSVQQQSTPLEKLSALRSSSQGAQPKPLEVEFPASQGDMAFDYVRSLDRGNSASSPTFGLPRLRRRQG